MTRRRDELAGVLCDALVWVGFFGIVGLSVWLAASIATGRPHP